MRLLVIPRNDESYQKCLYAHMRQCGAEIFYLGEVTRSHSVNILLLPLETVVWRFRGVRLIHIHWVYYFMLPGASRIPVLRWIAEVWFVSWLYLCRILSMHIVWTAHNVLPHERVFADDVRARRALVKAAALLVAHSRSTLDELGAFGAVAARTVIIQHGPIEPTVPAEALRVPGRDEGPLRFLFVGRVLEYKGVEDLLKSFIALPSDVNAQLLVAGQCMDEGLERRLRRLAGMCADRVEVRFEYIADEELPPCSLLPMWSCCLTAR